MRENRTSGSVRGALGNRRSYRESWKGRRECHIESDWLLIYKQEEVRIIFERTGTHSDLFQK